MYSCGDDGIVRAWGFAVLPSNLPTEDDFNDKGHLVRITEDDVDALRESISVRYCRCQNSFRQKAIWVFLIFHNVALLKLSL